MTVTVTELPNGLRVVSDTMDQVETVSLGAWVEVGARDEDADINGISHLLEHMAFKGTQRRDAKAIAEEIENVGGHLNAYTTRESTAYYAKIMKEDMPLAVDIIADILQHSVMDSTELSREQDVIVQEINQSFDTPDDVVFDYFQETAFPDQALGRPVLGTADLVRAMTPDTLLGYIGKHYSATGMVFAAAGNLDHQRLVDLAEDAFDSLPEPTNGGHEQARYVGGDSHQTRDLEQAHVLVGLEGMAFDDPDFYAASVMSTVLGGGMSSRLFQEIREKRGMAYAIYAYLQCYTDGGLFGVYAGTDKSQVEELVPLIFAQIKEISGGLLDTEIARARAQIKAGILMSLESTSSRSEQLARQMMVFKKPLSIEDTIAKVEAVDEDAIKRVAERLLASPPTLTTLGPE
ncbi:MAG TPA: insulinase family protein [Rhodospirillales bacterium]|mgnify:FL=1|jgi:predicted Zn-dependent peptidase|nr:insulinase family protein [Rhodospirillales bacterium]HIM24364.1 insulinase family protein [Rhodospirillales bacterium]